jgi:hypothetical protein
MLNSGKKNCASRDKKKKFNSCVVRKKISERNKNHNSPLQVKWLVSNINDFTQWLRNLETDII